MPANAHALTHLPSGNAGAHFIDDAHHFMSWDTGILNAGPKTFLGEHVAVWQTPQACTLMRTCPASGSGISRSTISKSPPGLDICATFIGSAAGLGATLSVAINAPY